MLAPQLAQGQHGQCMPALNLVLVPSGTELLSQTFCYANALLSCSSPLQRVSRVQSSCCRVPCLLRQTLSCLQLYLAHTPSRYAGLCDPSPSGKQLLQDGVPDRYFICSAFSHTLLPLCRAQCSWTQPSSPGRCGNLMPSWCCSMGTGRRGASCLVTGLQSQRLWQLQAPAPARQCTPAACLAAGRMAALAVARASLAAARALCCRQSTLKADLVTRAPSAATTGCLQPTAACRCLCWPTVCGRLHQGPARGAEGRPRRTPAGARAAPATAARGPLTSGGASKRACDVSACLWPHACDSPATRCGSCHVLTPQMQKELL